MNQSHETKQSVRTSGFQAAPLLESACRGRTIDVTFTVRPLHAVAPRLLRSPHAAGQGPPLPPAQTAVGYGCGTPSSPGTGSRLTAAIIGRIEHPRGTVLELRNLTHNVLPSGPW